MKNSNYKKNKIVILGGSGFVGSRLIKQLLDDGYRNIINISAEKPRENTKISHIVAHISDKSVLDKNISAGDFVFHLAESLTPATSEINRADDMTRSLTGALNVLDICVNKKVDKIIFASSGGTVYGSGNKPFNETDGTYPESSYGIIKLAIEKYINLYNHLYGLNYLILRIANIYGREDLGNRKPALETFLVKTIANENIIINGDGKTIRDYIFIEDVIDFMIFSIKKPSLTGIYNLGTGIGTSLNELTKIIGKITNKKMTVEHLPAKRQDAKYNVLNISRANSVGWKPKITLEEGIRRLYNTITDGK